MTKRVDTTEYQTAHKCVPRGWGNWRFRVDNGNTCNCIECRAGEELRITGMFAEVRKSLPKGKWKVQP